VRYTNGEETGLNKSVTKVSQEITNEVWRFRMGFGKVGGRADHNTVFNSQLRQTFKIIENNENLVTKFHQIIIITGDLSEAYLMLVI